MWWVVWPLMRRAASRYDSDGAGADRAALIALVLAGVLISTWATETIGVALIIGALVMGAVMPKRAALMSETDLWLITAALLAIAVAGKLGATMLAARLTGYGWKPATVLGTLMNTRGLTELIILNLGLEIGVISEALFTALVLMALLTTFMAGPLLGLLDQRPDKPQITIVVARLRFSASGSTSRPHPWRGRH